MQRTDLRRERVEAGGPERRPLYYSRRNMWAVHTRVGAMAVAKSV